MRGRVWDGGMERGCIINFEFYVRNEKFLTWIREVKQVNDDYLTIFIFGNLYVKKSWTI